MKLFGNTHGKKKRSAPAPRRPFDAYEADNVQPRGPEQPPARQEVPPSRPVQQAPQGRPAPRPQQAQSPAGQNTQPYRPRQQGEKNLPPYSKAAAKYAGYDGYEPYRTPEDKRKIEAMIANYQRKKLIRRLVLLAVLVVLVVVGVILWKAWVKPPEMDPLDPVTSQNPNDPADPSADPSQSPAASIGNRREGVYTFLVVGNDDGNGNTDTILVGVFDTVQEKMDVVSIPRDTLVNVSWSVKKINTVLSQRDMDGLKDELSKILGFRIDSYGVVDLDAFVALVDSVDGVDFEVPVDMNYSDPVQDLYINISAGYQHLTGKQAVQVVRFRSGYANADLGRIQTQQAFLKALAAKCLTLGNLVKNASNYADIFKTYVETDLTLGNLIWYCQQFAKLDEGDINFYTLPTVGEWLGDLSYISIDVDEWLPILNENLNPLKTEIQLSDLSIVARNADGVLSMTDGSEMYTNYYVVGSSSGSGNNGGSQTQEPPDDPKPSDSPEPSPSPSTDPGTPPPVEPEPSDDPTPSDSPVPSDTPQAGGSEGTGTSEFSAEAGNVES